MRWTSRIRFVFLLPAVIWVLAFTIFPLGYSLYLAFYKIEQKVEITRVKEPMVDAQGQPVLDAQGQPRTKNVVIKNQVNTATFIGLFNFKRLFTDPQVWEAIKVTAVFVLIAVPVELIFGLAARAPVQSQASSAGRCLRTVMILPIFATPLAVGYTFFTIFYEVGGPLGWTGIPFLSNPALGAGLGHLRRHLAVDAVLLPGLPRRPPGRYRTSYTRRPDRRRRTAG